MSEKPKPEKRPRSETDAKPTWRPPTRRAFVGMLGAALAALAVRESVGVDSPAEPARSPWAGKTRWIGHC